MSEDDNGLRCDNWHDTVRLVLLRCLGVHRRDLRRWLLKRLEELQMCWYLQRKPAVGLDVTFHSLCVFRVNNMREFPELWDCKFDKYLNAENVRQRKKIKH